MFVPTTTALAAGAKDIGVPETVIGAAPGISDTESTMYCPAELAVIVEPAIVKIGVGTRAWVLPAMMTVKPEGASDTGVP